MTKEDYYKFLDNLVGKSNWFITGNGSYHINFNSEEQKQSFFDNIKEFPDYAKHRLPIFLYLNGSMINDIYDIKLNCKIDFLFDNVIPQSPINYEPH